MDKAENEKFDQVIQETYNELLRKRAKKPLHHAIFYMLSTLPEELRDKDNEVKEFYQEYKEKHLPEVQELKMWSAGRYKKRAIMWEGDMARLRDAAQTATFPRDTE